MSESDPGAAAPSESETSDTDPGQLADHLEGEADKLQDQSKRLAGDVEGVRQDWEQKRSDESVPGAPPPEGSDDEEAQESPGPEAPPEGAEPSQAETASEGATGPPKDQVDDKDEDA